MTVADIADHVCSIVGKTDADSIAQAKEFVRRRWRLLWKAALWRDSLGAETLAVPAGQADVTLSAGFDFPVAVRWHDSTALTPIDWETVFQLDAAWFEREGSPTHFIVKPKVAGQAVLTLLEIPREARNLLVLAKKVVPELTNDTDEPTLRGAVEALLALVESDMLRRLRQYGKAAMVAEEAVGMLEVMRSQESFQQARVTRFIPAATGHCDWHELGG